MNDIAARSPSVSIGIPVRNGAPFLRQAISSLLNQTYRDFELIISDNASDDDTVAIAREYAQLDQRVRLFTSGENKGAAENYNRVFDEARGRYFKWAAADDICLPDYLQQCVDVLDRSEDIVLCYPRTRLIDADGNWIADYVDNMHIDHNCVSRRLRLALCNVVKANCVFGLIRTNALRQTRLIGSYRASDYVLLAELAMIGKFHEVPTHLFLRRIHAGQSGAGKSDREIARWFHPHRAGGQDFPMWRLLAEHRQAIHHMRPTIADRIKCYFQLIHWLRPRRNALLGELGRAAKMLPTRFVKRALCRDECSSKLSKRVAAGE